MIDAFASSLIGHSPELVEDCGSGRVDQIVAERELDERPVALRDMDKPRRAGTAKFVQFHPVNPGDLIGVWVDDRVCAAPKDKGRDHIP